MKRIDNFLPPTKAKQIELINDATKAKELKEIEKNYSYKDKNGIKYYRFLTVLCRENRLYYPEIRYELSKGGVLSYRDV